LNTARWSQVRDLLEAALEREPTEREDFVRSACSGDRELEADVWKLLSSEDASRGLEPPGAGWPGAPRTSELSMLGARVGRYRILRLIGYGGMGAVYEAEQDQPRRTVALKVMRPSLATPRALRRFEFEAQVLARLRHPSIAAVFEAGTHNPDPADPSRSMPYFAMELVQGAAPITEFARARKLSTRERLELFAQVCDAVHHGHQQGVIHRDLKPGNVLVDGDGRPRIIDFGIARTLERDSAASQSGGQTLGTLQYMSPEQCSVDGEGIDTRSDVYSLGVLLYELLANRAPYAITGTSIAEAMRRVCEVDPPPLGQIDRTLRGDVETIARTAMEKGREQRYAAASSLASDIRRYLRSEPISARPPTAMYHLRVFARRNKSLVASATVVLVVLVAGIVATSIAWRSSRAETRRVRRIADFYKETITTGTPFLAVDLSPGWNWWEDPPAPRGAKDKAPGSFAVPDLLEVAGSRLERTFADEPEIEAELYDTLGRTLTYMGRAQAIEFLARALEIRERTLGPDHPDTIRSRLAYAVRQEGSGSFAAAEAKFRTALESCVRAFGADDARTIAVERRYASSVSWLDTNRGFELGRASYEHARRALGDDDPETMIAREGFASGLRSQGDLRGAETVAREALAGWIRVTGDGSLEVAQARIALAGFLTVERSFTEAESLLQAGLPVLREHFGGDIVHTLPWELQLVQLLRRMPRPAQAATEMRRVVDSARSTLGADTFHPAKLEATFARTLLESGEDLEEAERVARHAWEVLEPGLRNGDYNSAAAKDALHCVIRARGRASEAATMAAELLRIVNGWGTSEAQVLAPLHQTIGECELDLGHVETAATELADAWRIAEEGDAFKSDPYHPRRLALMESLARVEDARGRPEEAAAWRGRLPESERH
jgi:serine/threonine protein kinase